MRPHLKEIDNLSVAEKLQLVEDLWDEICEDPSNVPVYEWQKQELARRKARHQENPDSVVT